ARPAARFSSASLIALCLAGTSLAGTAPSAPAAPPAAPLADLVAQVNIPFERFQLANGLTVIVHTDRKAPIVGVTTYYRVGSKNEPKGHTGFAHLYEHLFFGGSANAPSFDEPLEQAGATATNGSTSYDRTNYVETVPKGALDLALFLESDRMGHLLAAVTQDKLDKQRGVVENEKRQDDNQPYGLLSYALAEGLFPVGHPYRHTPLGSMADLDAATLGDVRAWFTQHYAPGNVVLVLTGDIDAATARPLVERYFGAIPAGPKVEPVAAGPVTLAAPRARAMTDRVATTTLYRAWSGPGVNDPDAEALEIGMTVLGGLASSRLDNALVRGRQLAVGVTASDEQNEQVSQLTASLSIKPGVPRAEAEAAFDAEIARFLAEGPTADELRRAATRTVAEEIGALEVIGGFGGKGAQLAEGQLYSGDPAHYRAELARIAALTPEAVRDAMRRWLGRPAYNLTVNPGERTEKGDAMGGWGDEAATPARPVDAKKPVPPIAAGAPRPQPAVAPVGALAFPAVEHARLSNGMAVDLARRTAVPKVLVSLGFDAGVAADAVDAPGTQGLLLAMLQEGTAGAHPRDATQVLEEQERLGATISAGASLDTSTVTLDALKANLAPSLGLLADVLRSPAFAAGDLARVKQQRLTALEQTLASPQGQAARALNPLLFGPGTPYGQPGDGLGSKASLAALDGPALRKAMGEWLRPDNARITIVGDITMAEALP
ncbi:MAG TPA: insulinase family protein, partial [Novosphingobium sp.]|nr:insulinase family protein [Novosphingobium sp.]